MGYYCCILIVRVIVVVMIAEIHQQGRRLDCHLCDGVHCNMLESPVGIYRNTLKKVHGCRYMLGGFVGLV